MTVAWRAGWRWLLVVGLTAGCGGVRAPDGTPPPRGSRQLDAADALVQEGRYADAREAYAMAMAEQAASPDRALLGLARLRRELQRAQQQTVRLRDEREQLRQIDAEFERPRSPEIAPTSTPVPSRPRD